MSSLSLRLAKLEKRFAQPSEQLTVGRLLAGLHEELTVFAASNSPDRGIAQELLIFGLCSTEPIQAMSFHGLRLVRALLEHRA